MNQWCYQVLLPRPIGLSYLLRLMNPSLTEGLWSERPSAGGSSFADNEGVFDSLFQRSADAIWLHEVSDAGVAVLMDCNQAAVELIGAESKEKLLGTRPEELS